MQATKKTEIVEMHADERGTLTAIRWHDEKGGTSERMLIETNAGFARGGETHPTRQHAIQLEGLAGWIIRGRDGEKAYSIHEVNSDFTVEANVPHVYVAFTRSLMLKYLEGGRYVAEYDPTYRLIVTELGMLEKELEAFKSMDKRVEQAINSLSGMARD